MTVRVDAGVQCRRLSAVLNWRTHGKGNRDEGPGESLGLFDGDWNPGEYHYPFRFMAPTMPATYHGHFVNVDHYVAARADIPWATDPKAETDLLIVGGDRADFTTSKTGKAIAPADVHKATRAIPSVAIGCGGLVALVCLVIMAVAVGADVLAGGRVMEILLALLSTFPAPLFFLVGLAAMGWGAFRKMRAAHLGEPEVSVEPLQPTVGGPVIVSIALNPRKDVVLEEAWFDLVCKETATSGSGTNQTHHRHELFRDRRRFEAGGTTIPAGQTTHRRDQLPIPAGSPVSFASEHNRLAWSVEAQVKVQGWPAWSITVPVTVGSATART